MREVLLGNGTIRMQVSNFLTVAFYQILTRTACILRYCNIYYVKIVYIKYHKSIKANTPNALSYWYFSFYGI